MTLGYVARALVQALAAHVLVSTALTVIVLLAWQAVAARPAAAWLMSRRLFRLRLAPSVVGLAAASLVLVAYRVQEGHVESERVGLVAAALALSGVCLVAAAVWRIAVAALYTRRIQQALARTSRERLPALPMPAYVVDSTFPVVALVGLVLFRLFVARRVIEACTPEEFDAVVAHEQAHARQRDNLRRLAMAAAPDLLALLAGGRRLEEAWAQAAEMAADECAARSSSGVHLASALVKVARLATTPPGPMPASALFRGESITARVHRLLDPPPSPSPRPWPAWAALAAVASLAAAALLVLPAVHAAAEHVLRLGL